MGTARSQNARENGQTIHGIDKISTSTWGATFAKARQVYSAVVRPAMTYGSTVWHMPKEVKKSKTSTSKLSVMQNNCLRTIAGAFKATPISVLEAGTLIAPIDTHLDMLQAQARHWLRAGGQLKIIPSACNKIADKLRGKAGRKRLQKPTPGELKHIWAKSLLIDSNSSTTKGTPTMVRSLPGVAPRSYRCGNGPTQADANNQSTTNEGLERLVVRISKSRHRTLHSTINTTEQKSAENIHAAKKGRKRSNNTNPHWQDRVS